MMKARTTPGANVEKNEKGYILKIPAGDSSSYRFAQVDDYFGLPRRNFPHHSLTLSLRARVSSLSLPGTWGFGAWNDPFGISLGFGANRLRLPTLPNAAWFFGASKENHLSFTGGLDTPRKERGATRPPLPGNGFLAQTFRSPRFHPSLFPAGLTLPFSPKTTRRILSSIISEDSSALGVDVTQWHSYKMDWNENGVKWFVDDSLVFETSVSPNPPLGLVIWIDNQFASFTPDGKIGFGVLENPESAWLEISELSLSDRKNS